MSPAAAPAATVVVDAAGARMGGAARYLDELRGYLERSRRGDVRVIGAGRGLGPAWLLRREASAAVARARRRVALNNVAFCGPGGERRTLLHNALHFLSAAEEAELDTGLLARAQRQAAIVRLAARRSDVLIVPSTAMADRVRLAMPGVSDRVVVRPHPVSAHPAPATQAEPAIVCPVLFAPYKHMPQRLRELLAALDTHQDPQVRAWVTAEAGEVPADLAAHPRVDLLGRRGPQEAAALVGRARAVYFPGGLESFGYPLAEARASGRPVIARDTTQNQEIAGAALCGYTPGDPASLELAVKTALAATVTPDSGPFDPHAYFDWLLGPS
jgi:glycosyltransferase involved in cell wall biosynthesis